MCRICSNTDGSKSVFLYENNKQYFHKIHISLLFSYFTLMLLCKRAHIAAEQFDEDFLVVYKIFCYFIYLFMILVTLVDFVSKKINIRWEYNKIDDPLKITFTEIPFIQLVRHQYQCHQGKDINYKKKENYK